MGVKALMTNIGRKISDKYSSKRSKVVSLLISSIKLLPEKRKVSVTLHKIAEILSEAYGVKVRVESN